MGEEGSALRLVFGRIGFVSVGAGRRWSELEIVGAQMGSRHGNKQLQRAVRARMARTGESFQAARARVLALRAERAPARAPGNEAQAGADLLAIRYFGVPLALATFEVAGRLAVVALSGPRGRGPLAKSPLFALGASRAVH